MAKKPTERILTDEEVAQRNELCEYVKKNILLYDENQKMPDYLVHKLNGLREGKFVSNKKTPKYAKYGYDIILYAFKIHRFEILNALNGKKIENEKNKINYFCAIIEGKINDVYIRITNAKKAQEKVESMDVDSISNESAEYKPKTTKTNEKLNDIW